MDEGHEKVFSPQLCAEALMIMPVQAAACRASGFVQTQDALHMLESPFRRIKGFRAYVLAGLLALISLIHYLAAGVHTGILHGLLGHLYIVPIILGAYWYGIRGDVVTSIASVALFSPHLFLHWHDPFLTVYNYFELFLFMLIGGVTCVLNPEPCNRK